MVTLVIVILLKVAKFPMFLYYVLLQKAKVQFDTLTHFPFNLKQRKIVQRRHSTVQKWGGAAVHNVVGIICPPGDGGWAVE